MKHILAIAKCPGELAPSEPGGVAAAPRLRQSDDPEKKPRRTNIRSGFLHLDTPPPAAVKGLQGTYMCSIITCPKPEQLTWVAPSIKRAKS